MDSILENQEKVVEQSELLTSKHRLCMMLMRESKIENKLKVIFVLFFESLDINCGFNCTIETESYRGSKILIALLKLPILKQVLGRKRCSAMLVHTR